ncbi:unnamed protein product [Prorocentrum cordatum]|uniref:H(+)-exporting diphosphatase n=1 Tax=Prorocentrum cordatum TaxID=2364126 RepID=A0ABN9XYD1_9DINO|nr:unnamed protein product [Polarella glacialis]
MPSYKEEVVEWAISASRYGVKWWMPILLIGVSMLNTLTGGVFIWCVGIVQAVLFTVVGMSNGKVGVIVAPLCLTAGASIAAIMYIQVMKTSGADALLERTGAKDSKFLAQAQETRSAPPRGDAPLAAGQAPNASLQVNPLTPVPTAVLVVAGMLAKMDEVTVFSVLMAGKFLMLLLNSVAVYYVSEGQTVEDVSRSTSCAPRGSGGAGRGNGDGGVVDDAGDGDQCAIENLDSACMSRRQF